VATIKGLQEYCYLDHPLSSFAKMEGFVLAKIAISSKIPGLWSHF